MLTFNDLCELRALIKLRLHAIEPGDDTEYVKEIQTLNDLYKKLGDMQRK